MEINNRIEDDICIVSFKGNLVLDDAQIFKKHMKPLTENKSIKGFALNFSYIDFIDSSGISFILMTFKKLQQQGVKMVIYNINQKINEVFKAMHLDEMLPLREIKKDALSFLKGNYEN